MASSTVTSLPPIDADRGLDSVYIDSRNVVFTDDEFGKARISFEETNQNINTMMQSVMIKSSINQTMNMLATPW